MLRTRGQLLDLLLNDLDDKAIERKVVNYEIAKVIKDRRLAMGISQERLADKIGMSQSTIASWESGQTNFNMSTLVDIADKLDLEFVCPPQKQNIKVTLDCVQNSRKVLSSFEHVQTSL